MLFFIKCIWLHSMSMCSFMYVEVDKLDYLKIGSLNFKNSFLFWDRDEQCEDNPRNGLPYYLASIEICLIFELEIP